MKVDKIDKVLDNFGIPSGLDGRAYLHYIIREMMKKRCKIGKLYERVGYIMGLDKSYQCVERSIRYAIDKMNWNKWFDKRPSNSKFVDRCIREIDEMKMIVNVGDVKEILMVLGAFDIEVCRISDCDFEKNYENYEDFVNDYSINNLELIDTDPIEVESFKVTIWVK